MANKLVNVDLNEKQLELANWFITEVSEFRQLQDNSLLAFLRPSQIEELSKMLVELDYDYFTDGTMKLEYNGEDLVLDISDILKYTLNFTDPKLIYDSWEDSDA